jgi:hypothetical protein
VVFLTQNRHLWLSLLCCCLLTCTIGCGGSTTSGVTQTSTKTRIESLYNLYKSYIDVKKKSPPNEQALRDHYKELTEQQLDEMLISRDLEAIFVSDRDNQPFQVAYGQNLNPGGEPVAVIYEKTGANGTKYVALSIGYSEEYDAETLQQYLPKKK